MPRAVALDAVLGEDGDEGVLAVRAGAATEAEDAAGAPVGVGDVEVAVRTPGEAAQLAQGGVGRELVGGQDRPQGFTGRAVGVDVVALAPALAAVEGDVPAVIHDPLPSP